MAIGWDAQTGIVGLTTLQEKLADWQQQLRSGAYAIHPNFLITTPPGTSELSPEQAIFGLLATEIISAENTVALLFDQLSDTTAEGVGLDALYSLLDLFRRPANPTTVKVQVSGVPFATLNNQLVLHEGSKQLFKFPSVFAMPNTGAAQTTLTSVENLAIQITSGDSVWTPVNPPNTSISTITAILDSVVGNPPESDEAFRLRTGRELGNVAIASEDAIIAGVSSLSGVASINGEFNRSPNMSLSGVPGWHMEVVVEGGVDLDIENMIDLLRHAEEATFGTVSITSSSGRIINITRPTFGNVQVEMTIVNTGADVLLDTDTRAAIAAEIVESVVTRINFEQGVGDDISPSGFSDIVIIKMPEQSIAQITILASRLGDPLDPGLVGITKRERAQVSFSDITVNIV